MKGYRHDIKRRWRNLFVVESRFQNLLKPNEEAGTAYLDALLLRVMKQMSMIRPRLLELLKKNPESLGERLSDFFGVPVYVGSDASKADLVSTSAESGTIQDPSGIKETSHLKPPKSQSQQFGIDFVAPLMETLLQKYETIYALESEVWSLSRQNAGLLAQLFDVNTSLSALQQELCEQEQSYLDSLTQLSDASYVSSRKISSLKELVCLQIDKRIKQESRLFHVENALAMQCYLNNIPCPEVGWHPRAVTRLPEISSFSTVAETSMESKLANLDAYNFGMYQSFDLNDKECSTSTYNSDVYSSFDGVAIEPSSLPASRYPHLELVNIFDEAVNQPSPLVDSKNVKNGAEELFQELEKTLNLCIGPAVPGLQALPQFPTVPAVPEQQSVENPLPLPPPVTEDTKVRELQAEISVLQRKTQRYLREIRKLKREKELLQSAEDARKEAEQEETLSRKQRNEGIDVGTETAEPREDTKIKELKAEIYILQKQIQRLNSEIAAYQRMKEMLVSEESRNMDLRKELSIAERTLASYRHEAEAILRKQEGMFTGSPRHINSSTAVSGDHDQGAKSGSTMTEVRNAFLSLQDRLSSYESTNAALSSQIENLYMELNSLKRENELLSSDTKAAGQLTLDRLLHSVTNALDCISHTSYQDSDFAFNEDGSSASTPSFTTDNLFDQRTSSLEYENQMYREKIGDLFKALRESSIERCQMDSTVARLTSELYGSNQLLQKLKKHSTKLMDISNDRDLVRSKCEILEDQVDKLKQMNTDLSDLNNRLNDDLRSLEEQSLFTGNEANGLREEVKQLQSLLVGGQSAPHDAIRDRVAIIQLEGRCKLLGEYLSSCKFEVESLRTRNTDLVKSVMEMRYSLEQERLANVNYAKQVAVMSESEGQLRSQVDLQQSQIEGLRASVASLNESLEKSAADISSYSSKLVEKERSESALSATVNTLERVVKTLLAAIREIKPFLISHNEINAVDLGYISNFDLGVYYGVVDSIQKCMSGPIDKLEHSDMIIAVNAAREKIQNITKCNYLLGALASGLCRQFQDMNSRLLSQAQSGEAALSAVISALNDQVNSDISRAELSSKIGRLQAQVKELKAHIKQLQRSHPTETISCIKQQYETELSHCKGKIEQLSASLKEKENEQSQLKQENLKLISDCTGAAHALNDFEKRLDTLKRERTAFCQHALSLLPPITRSECDTENAQAILTLLRSHLTKYSSYKEKYQKLLESRPDPPLTTVSQAPSSIPVHTSVTGSAKLPSVNSIDETRNHVCNRLHVEDNINNNTDVLRSIIADMDTNVRYYIKSIKSSLRGHLRGLAHVGDSSDTDYESPNERSVARSDATLDDAELDSSDPESEEAAIYTFYNKTRGEELVRRHTRQFDVICDMLDRMGKAQSQLIERPPRVVYVDKPAPPRSQPVTIDGDMAVMHHFSRLSAALKDCVLGSSLAITVDDVFYQLEMVMLDQGDRERRRAMWNRCIGDIVSLVTDVLKSSTIERNGTIEELERRYNVVCKALDEAQSLCRIREEELHRRTVDLSETCDRLELLQQHCRKLEVELDTRANEKPLFDDSELRSLESELSYREEEVHRLSKEINKLHSVVMDLEDVNSLLSQQLDLSRSEATRLANTVDSQQRQISSLNSEISHLELEAERRRRGY